MFNLFTIKSFKRGQGEFIYLQDLPVRLQAIRTKSNHLRWTNGRDYPQRRAPITVSQRYKDKLYKQCVYVELAGRQTA